jgi:hypothetical protein
MFGQLKNAHYFYGDGAPRHTLTKNDQIHDKLDKMQHGQGVDQNRFTAFVFFNGVIVSAVYMAPPQID